MSKTRLDYEQAQSLAFKLAVLALGATAIVVGVGGFHYLSTTNNFSQPGSLAILGYSVYPLAVAVVGAVVGVGCNQLIERDVKRHRQESREADDRPSTLDVVEDRNRRY